MRTRLRGTESVGEVYQATHMVLDLRPTRRYREDGQTGPISFARMFKERRPENPLLLLYIIDQILSRTNSGVEHVFSVTGWKNSTSWPSHRIPKLSKFRKPRRRRVLGFGGFTA